MTNICVNITIHSWII